jgi:hypothetical protein
MNPASKDGKPWASTEPNSKPFPNHPVTVRGLDTGIPAGMTHFRASAHSSQEMSSTLHHPMALAADRF